MLGDKQVFVVRVPRAGKTAQQRATDATKALGNALSDAKATEVTVLRRGDVAVVRAGETPVIQLVAEDAVAAGDSSLEVHAASTAAEVRKAIAAERQRLDRSHWVFSISWIVFFGLIAFYLARQIGEFAERARVWIDTHGERVLSVRIRQIEVVSPGTVRSTALVALSVGKWFAQLGVLYAWLAFVLSLFDATAGYTEKLTGFVVSPVSQLMTRVATSLPVLFVLAVVGFAVFILVRFLGLFFGAVERRETVVGWLSPDLAAPTSTIVRFGIVVAALLFLAPLVTGNVEGALGRSGAVVLVAIGLAATPVLASAVLGAIVLYGRRLRPGQYVQIGDYAGRISAIGLLDVRLEDRDHVEVRIPHLYALRHPTRVLGLRPKLAVDVPIGAGARHGEVRDILALAAARFGQDARIELVRADAEGAIYRLSLSSDMRDARSELQLAVLEALAAAHVPLGRLGTREAAP
jgi:small-conductance mechanosensitive channel